MDNKKIGQKIASQRAKLNLTQTALAEKLCVSPKTVSKWESGNGLPSLEFLPVLSKMFGISIDELLCKEQEGISLRTLNEDLNAMAIFRILSPNYANYPERVKEQLKEDWLNLILQDEGIELSEYYDFVNSRSKPKSLEDCVNKLFNMDTVSNSGIQKRLRIGYPKACNIRDNLIKEHLIDENTYEWISKDADILTDILKSSIKESLFAEEPSTIYTNIDFEKINIINDSLSVDEKNRILKLLADCTAGGFGTESSAICFIEREALENLLLISENNLVADVYNINSLQEFQEVVAPPKTDYALLIVEARQEAEILEVMSLCDLKIPAEISMLIANDLEKTYRITILYEKKVF